MAISGMIHLHFPRMNQMSSQPPKHGWFQIVERTSSLWVQKGIYQTIPEWGCISYKLEPYIIYIAFHALSSMSRLKCPYNAENNPKLGGIHKNSSQIVDADPSMTWLTKIHGKVPLAFII